MRRRTEVKCGACGSLSGVLAAILLVSSCFVVVAATDSNDKVDSTTTIDPSQSNGGANGFVSAVHKVRFVHDNNEEEEWTAEATAAKRNNYDPHAPPSVGPWFEGWYTRVVDREGKYSFGIMAGSFCGSGVSCNYDANLPGYMALIQQVIPSNSSSSPSKAATEDQAVLFAFKQRLLEGKAFASYNTNATAMEVWELFPNATSITIKKGEPVDVNPDFSSPPDFEWKILGGEGEDGAGCFFRNDAVYYVSKSQGVKFSAKFKNPLYWEKNKPGEGPEGNAIYLPLQQHWFVYSLGSDAVWQFLQQNSSVSLSGSGWAHQEKNWGVSFPKAWIWSEGMAENNTRHFAVTGGNVPVIGPIAVTAWLVGYRSPRINWSFRPQNVLTSFTPGIDACSGSFNMTVQTPVTKRLVFTMKAPVKTYTPLSVPSLQGWVPDGCVETYVAETVVEAYENGYLVDWTVFRNSALEFGGEYMCKP
ncbi:Tocopherol cyclase [Balamuthia mandrillaris]